MLLLSFDLRQRQLEAHDHMHGRDGAKDHHSGQLSTAQEPAFIVAMMLRRLIVLSNSCVWNKCKIDRWT